MPGTVHKIIERIKDRRSGGNSVVALTAETRLVLQGFDPERFDEDTPDDPGRLARIRDIAAEMKVDIADLLEQADAAPDAGAVPAPAPGEPVRSGAAIAAAQATAAAAGLAGTRQAAPEIPDDHPLHAFKTLIDEAGARADAAQAPAGKRTGAPFSVLVRASLLMALYSIATDRVFCDQLRYNALFQWFLELAPGTAYDADDFAADRAAALDTDVARHCFDYLVPRAGRQQLFANALIQADGRHIKAWMSPRANA